MDLLPGCPSAVLTALQKGLNFRGGGGGVDLFLALLTVSEEQNDGSVKKHGAGCGLATACRPGMSACQSLQLNLAQEALVFAGTVSTLPHIIIGLTCRERSVHGAHELVVGVRTPGMRDALANVRAAQ